VCRREAVGGTGFTITMLQLRREKRQRQLFEEAPAAHARVHLPVSVQEQLRQTLVQSMQALAKNIHKEVGDE